MDTVVGFVVVAALAAAVLVYLIHSVARTTADERKKKHEEFNAQLEPSHRESLARIAGQRDAEIAKYTHKPPVQTVDGEARRIGSEGDYDAA